MSPALPLAQPPRTANPAAVKTDAETGFALVAGEWGTRTVAFRDFGDGFTAFGSQEDFEFDMESGDYFVWDEDGRVGDRLTILACARDEASLAAPKATPGAAATPIRREPARIEKAPPPPVAEPYYDKALGF